MTDSKNKPVIFLAFANDRDDTVGYLRNLPDEARRLRDVLKHGEQAGLCEVVSRSNCTAGDIFKVFQDPKYRNRIGIFHYGGHANGYQLILESAKGEAAAADAGGLAAFLSQQQGLQLVFLNGCSTQQQSEGLLEARIPAVISTSRSIDDRVATNFAFQFYQGLAGGATIRTAYHEAEAATQTATSGDLRSLYFGEAGKSQDRLDTERFPWNLFLREGSEIADQWNLPEAVNDPLFCLPSLPEQDLPESPFRNLSRFRRNDAEVFFGRGHQIRELYDRLTAPRSAPIMLIYGQSGVGKSSILDAGLIPRLERDHEICYLRRTAGGLVDTLRLAFVREAPEEEIENAWLEKEKQTGKPLIVFLDQVEELFTRPIASMPDELDQFLKAVNATFVKSDPRPRGKLVLGFRKEWLAELESHLIDHELPRTKVYLGPLDRAGIIEAVQGPARSQRLRDRYGLSIDEGLAEIIADDLLEDRDSAIAPTLQILLTKMWNKAKEQNTENPTFSQDLYQQLRRDGILLRDFLNQQVATFRMRFPEAVDSGLLLDIVALHTTPLGTAGQCSVDQLRQQYSHLGPQLPDLLQQCQDLYLLTIATNPGASNTKSTRLAHDTLAPLVREQFDESDKPGQRARRILDNRSVDWERDIKGTPLDEADLKVVERGLSGTRALNSTEQRLLEASVELRKKLQNNRKILKIAGAIALVAIIGLGSFGWLKFKEAESARRSLDKTNTELQYKTAEAIVQIALGDRDEKLNDLGAGVLFHEAASLLQQPGGAADSHTVDVPFNFDHLVMAGDWLFRGIDRRTDLKHELQVNDAWMLGDGRILTWTGGGINSPHQGRIEIWDLQSKSSTTLRETDETMLGVQPLGSENRWLIWHKKQAVVMDLLKKEEGIAVPFPENFSPRESAATNQANDKILFWNKLSGMAVLWDLKTSKMSMQTDIGKYVWNVLIGDQSILTVSDKPKFLNFELQPLPGKTPELPAITSFAANQESKSFMLGTANGNVIDPKLNKREIPYLDRIDGLVLSPNGQRLLVWGGTDAYCMGFDANTPFGPVMRHKFPIQGGEFSKDGSRVLTWSARRVESVMGYTFVSANPPSDARVWDATTAAPLTPWLQHSSAIRGARFVKGGGAVLSWSDDGLAAIWELTESSSLRRVYDHHDLGDVSSVSFSDDDRLVIRSSNKTIHWDLKTDAKKSENADTPDFNTVVSPDNSLAARVDTAKGEVQLFLPSDKQPMRLINHKSVAGVAFNLDGSRLATWGGDLRAVRFWQADGSPFVNPDSDQPLVISNSDYCRNVIFNPRGDLVAILMEDYAQLHNADTGQPYGQRIPFKGLDGARFTSERKQILLWGGHSDSDASEGKVVLWDIDQAEPGVPVMPTHSMVRGVLFNQDESLMIAWTSSFGPPKTENGIVTDAIYVFSRGSGLSVIPPIWHRLRISGATISSDSSTLVSWQSGRVCAWNLKPHVSPEFRDSLLKQ